AKRSIQAAINNRNLLQILDSYPATSVYTFRLENTFSICEKCASVFVCGRSLPRPTRQKTDRTQGPRPRPHTVDREAGMRGLVRTLVVLSAVLLVPASSFAQQASIAGVVKDASGAVLPGVSVEATSSVLTEKVRAVVS